MAAQGCDVKDQQPHSLQLVEPTRPQLELPIPKKTGRPRVALNVKSLEEVRQGRRTIESLAAEAGVSLQTVRRRLRGRPVRVGDYTRMLTVADVAKLCRVSAHAVTNWIREGKLEATRVAKRWLMKREEVQRLLDLRTKPAAARGFVPLPEAKAVQSTAHDVTAQLVQVHETLRELKAHGDRVLEELAELGPRKRLRSDDIARAIEGWTPRQLELLGRVVAKLARKAD